MNTFREHILTDKSIDQNDWNVFQKTLFEYGIGMEETLQFLYINQPNSIDFAEWIDKNKCIYQNLNIEDVPDALTQNDLDFWNKNGYVVLKNAISREDCLASQSAILEFLEASLDNPSSWYKSHEAKKA